MLTKIQFAFPLLCIYDERVRNQIQITSRSERNL